MADDREELQALRRMAELEAKAGGSSPIQAPVSKPPIHWGDAGAQLSAGDAYGAFQKMMENFAYKGGEGASDYAAKYLPPEAAAGVGLATNVGVQAIPTLLGGAVGSATKPVFQAAGRSLMDRALKAPLGDKISGDSVKAIETMLQQGYSPTKGGVEAMRGKIEQLGTEITDAIKNSTATINKNSVADRLNTAVEKFKSQVNPKADLAAVEKAWTEFLEHPDLVGKNDMPVQLAQKLKQGTYKALGDKPYGELSGAATESQKQLGRGLKEEISAAVPGVAEKNRLQGELINAKDIAERRALMEGNKNPLGLGTSIAAIAHDPMAALGMWANSSSALKARLARMLYSTPNTGIPAGIGAAAGALLGPSGSAPNEELAAMLRSQ